MKKLNRHLRIFVSSTFLDMFEEREALQKEVFLKFKNIAKKRNVEITEVDLRWGITEDEANKGETVKRCLDEIERCKKSPIFFLGIVGCRYGWKEWQQDINEALLESMDYNWISSLFGCSITELEIEAALRNHGESKAFLYLKKCTKKDKEVDGFHEKLKNISKKDSSISVNTYRNIEDFKKQTFDSFKNTLDKLFPEDEKLSELESMRNMHDVFSNTRKKLYIHDEANYEKISDFINQKLEYKLLIHGESGLGKSSLLANYFSQYKKRNDDLVIEHYIGAAGHNSGELFDIFRHIMLEIKEHYNVEDEIPNEKLSILESMDNWLQIPTHKTIIVLDGFNQLSEENRDNFFVYFQQEVYENIKLIITAIQEDYPFEDKWKLTPLNKAQQKVLINEYLLKYGKKLTKKNLGQIVKHEYSSNPLFLKLFLDEIRVFGVYEKLENMISSYLKSENIMQLFFNIFDRLEKDYETKHPGLLRQVLSLIYVSRDGLSETNLLEIINENAEENFTRGNYLTQLYLSPVLLAIEEQLVDRNGLYSFFHDYIRQAVYDKYLCNESNVLSYQKQILNYFSTKEASIQKFREYPWQLYQVGDDITLSLYLLDIDCFIYLSDNAYLDLLDYYIYSNEEFYIDELVQKSVIIDNVDFIKRVASFISMYRIDDKRAIVLFEKVYELSKIKYGVNSLERVKAGILLADELLVQLSINSDTVQIYTEVLNIIINNFGNKNNFIQEVRRKTNELSVRWQQANNISIYNFICELCGYSFQNQNADIYTCEVCLSKDINLVSSEKKKIEENFSSLELSRIREEISIQKLVQNYKTKVFMPSCTQDIIFLDWFGTYIKSYRAARILDYYIARVYNVNESNKVILHWFKKNKSNINYLEILRQFQSIIVNKNIINRIIIDGINPRVKYENLLGLIQMFLNNNGIFRDIDEKIVKWIVQNKRNENILNIIDIYNKYRGEGPVISIFIKMATLDMEYDHLINLINVYIKDHGNLCDIEENIVDWISQNQDHLNLQNIIKLFVDYNIDNLLTKEIYINSIKPSNTYEQTKYIVDLCLSKNIHFSCIDEKIVSWVKKNSHHSKVTNIIMIYIDNEGSFDFLTVLEDSITATVKYSTLKPNVNFYLDNGGHFNAIAEKILDCIYYNKNNSIIFELIELYKNNGGMKSLDILAITKQRFDESILIKYHEKYGSLKLISILSVEWLFKVIFNKYFDFDALLLIIKNVFSNFIDIDSLLTSKGINTLDNMILNFKCETNEDIINKRYFFIFSMYVKNVDIRSNVIDKFNKDIDKIGQEGTKML